MVVSTFYKYPYITDYNSSRHVGTCPGLSCETWDGFSLGSLFGPETCTEWDMSRELCSEVAKLLYPFILRFSEFEKKKVILKLYLKNIRRKKQMMSFN